MDSGYIDHVAAEDNFVDDNSAFYKFSSHVNDGKLPVAKLESINSTSNSNTRPPISRSTSMYEPNEQEHKKETINQYLERKYSGQSVNTNGDQSTQSTNSQTVSLNPSTQIVVNQTIPLKVEVQVQVIESQRSSGLSSVDSVSHSQSETNDSILSKSAPNLNFIASSSTTEVSSDSAPPKKKKLSPLFENFIKEMRGLESGVPIKDRKHYISASQFSTFHKCFVGTEAVDWLMNKMGLQEREHAVKLGNKMLEAGVIHHVLDKLPFLDSDDFYRFKVDD